MTGAEHLSPVKRALLELQRMRARVDDLERARTESIAVVGLGCRFPGAADPESFWSLLRDGVEAIGEIPKGRIDPAGWNAVPAPARRGGYLDNVRGFDAAFFAIAPREAAAMDPQQRLLLEVAWEALEHGGIAPSSLAGSDTGVFVGISNPDYGGAATTRPLSALEAHDAAGGAFSVASGRLSYVLGTTGPSLSIDTACSSSLVAVHLACLSLRAKGCALALAGGVNLILSPVATIKTARAGMLASDGRCKTFDAAADGYVRSEGCGLVVLKRLSDALAAGDSVLAVIRGTAVNQDGRSGGLTVPSGSAQQSLIRHALADAHLEPHEIIYVEAHGTGTALGDPIEVNALAAALAPRRAPDRKVLLGSVKTNVGHLESAAGIAGLIKTILALEYGEIPAHLHLRTPNPHIAWAELPVEVVTARQPWPAGRRLAGVSSFGFSGTNAHVIVEGPPEPVETPVAQAPSAHLLVISAHDERALGELAAAYDSRLGDGPVADVCASAAIGRAHLEHRLAVVGRTGSELQERLAAWRAREPAPGSVRQGRVLRGAGAPEVAFVFPGQGAQHPGMAREFYEHCTVFRNALDRCATVAAPALALPLQEVLYGHASEALDDTAYTQVALFAVEWALASVWRHWGVEPSIVLGHSIGEFVAATVAGVLDLDSAVALVAARGRLMAALPPGGAMAAVHAPESAVTAALRAHPDGLAIAAVNGPRSVVVSGAGPSVKAFCRILETQGIRSQSLSVTHAFHSSLMDPVQPAFASLAGATTFRAPQKTFVSTLTGAALAARDTLDAAYWARQLREPVRFHEALATARRLGAAVFVDVGPHPVLTGLGQEWLQDATFVPSLRRGRDGWSQMLHGLGALHVRGVPIDWAAVHEGRGHRRISLPTYPWQREDHWLETDGTSRHDVDAGSRWAAIVSAGRTQAEQAPLDLDLSSYAAKWRALEDLSTAFMIRTLGRLDVFGVAGEAWTAAELVRARGIAPEYRHLVARWLRRLAADGVLRQHPGESFVSPTPLPPAREDEALAAARRVLQDIPQVLAYVERCGRRLPDVLTGSASALETLFPAGGLDAATALYQEWAVSRYFSAIARSALRAALETGPGRALDVLEVGAGIGGTASTLVPCLDGGRGTYWFTDVSEAFLGHAREKLAAHPFVRYAVLDLERDPDSQGFAASRFDVIVATNVVHATRDVLATLERLHSLLVPGGLLMLVEATTHLAWFDVTTGLIEGWQRFEDSSRADSPLLPPDAWERALRAAGFDAVASMPEAGSPATVLGQHVFFARCPAPDGIPHAPRSASEETMVAAPETSARIPVGDVVRRLAAAPPGDRHALAVEYVGQQVAAVLRVSRESALDAERPLMDMGLDSLMALELRSRLAVGLGRPGGLPATLVFEHPTIAAVARYVVREAVGAEASPESRPGEPREALEAEARIAHLSDEEVAALLMKKLESL